MTLTRKLASALCLAFLFITLSSDAQVDSTTGNLINFTGTPTTTTSNWNNAGSVGAPLTCWQGGDPGYCGPNPRVSAWGANSNVINFSYGQVNLNQVININAGLASVGSNVRLSGFNFGFTAKNGNGWDDGRQDYLSAYVQIYDSKGSVVENYDYTQQTNRRYGWTNFNFSETFTKSYAPSTLSTAQVGFIGRDNNYWVGPYGPEIINVSFALKYTIKADPCIADPLSSPTCPGYAVATIKNSILGSTVSNASATSYSTANTYTPSPSTNTYNSPASAEVALASPTLDITQPTQQNTQSAQQQTQQILQTPQSSLTQDTNQNPSMAQDNPAQPSTQQAGPVSTTPQPAGGPSQTTQSSSPSASTGTSQSVPSRSNDGPRMTPGAALSVARAAQEKDKATQAMAVQAAAKTLEGSIQQSQASSNTAISMVQDMSTNSAIAAAQFSNQSTQASVQAALQSSQPQQFSQTNTQSQQSPQTNKMVQVQQQQEVQTSQLQSNSGVVQIQQFIYTPPQQQQETQSTQVAMLKPPTPPVVEMQQQSNSGTGITVSRNLFAYNPLISSNSSNMSAPLSTQQPMYQPRLDIRQSEVETPQFQIASFGGAGRAGNPLSEFMMEQRFELMQTSIAQPSSSVNRNVLPNELAGGIDIASIASVPMGFNAYSFILKDASFYEPKEVYKNQRTVDNERVLRGLTRGSDSLHQQMVDQQFKLGE